MKRIFLFLLPVLFIAGSCGYYDNAGEIVDVTLVASGDHASKFRSAMLLTTDVHLMHSMNVYFRKTGDDGWIPGPHGSLTVSVEAGFDYDFAVLAYTATTVSDGSCDMRGDLVGIGLDLSSAHVSCYHYFGTKSENISGPKTIQIRIKPYYHDHELNTIFPFHIYICSNDPCDSGSCSPPSGHEPDVRVRLVAFGGSLKLSPAAVIESAGHYFDSNNNPYEIVKRLPGMSHNIWYDLQVKPAGSTQYIKKNHFEMQGDGSEPLYICGVNNYNQ